MNPQVVTCTNRAPTEPYYILPKFRESLRRFGVDPTFLGWGEEWCGLMTKPRKLRDWLRRGDNASINLIVVDSWDLVFAASPEAVWEDFLKFDTDIVFNGELACFPDAGLAERFTDEGPYRYLNSGFFCGKAESILALLESMNLDAIEDDHQRPDGSWENPNDQLHYQLAYLNSPVGAKVDSTAIICQTLCGCRIEDFELSGPKIRNIVTGTRPIVFHGNGGSKDNGVLAAILSKLNL